MTNNGQDTVDKFNECHYELMKIRVKAVSLWHSPADADNATRSPEALLEFCIASATKEIITPSKSRKTNSTTSHIEVFLSLRGIYAQRALIILDEVKIPADSAHNNPC